MTKKLYIPVRAQRAADEALKNIMKKHQNDKTSKYKIVRKPGYRYELVENK